MLELAEGIEPRPSDYKLHRRVSEGVRCHVKSTTYERRSVENVGCIQARGSLGGSLGGVVARIGGPSAPPIAPRGAFVSFRECCFSCQKVPLPGPTAPWDTQGGMNSKFRKFLIHSVNHTCLLVDITAIGLPTEIFPPQGKQQTVPTLRFQSWSSARQYLHGLGATEQQLDGVEADTRRTSVSVLTVI